ncbi:universal stress protein [Streptomyces sp. LNU-CPARS28]|uniref:universal stress protein n=1 Tax=Streptomyces sp. LNU-CPARS28 TaxID=3137371 RepID=UPI0031355112
MMDVVKGGLVVGVDGSAAALAALRWSATKARLLRAPLVVVHAWQPTAVLRAPYAPAAGRRTPEQEHACAAATLEEAVAELLDADADVDFVPLLDCGPAERVLLCHTSDALLLALGRKPLRDVTGPALGAVARVCLRYAVCPVVTVPEPRSPGEQARPRPAPKTTAGLRRA